MAKLRDYPRQDRIRIESRPMKKPPPTARRPQDAMLRFDRLLAAMAPKVEAKRHPPPKPRKPRGPKRRSTQG